MFVRAKTIKGKKYAYLVKNRWTKMGPRQKVSKYLGRVIELSLKKDIHFEEFADPDTYSPLELVKRIIAYELYLHGFDGTKNKWALDDITVDLANAQVKKNKKKVVLGLNNDFLCNFTLRRLLRFKTTSDKDTAARELATAFIHAGIPVDQELFIKVFQMIYRPGQTYLRKNIAKKVIIVSGTPGTGKTTVSRMLSESMDLDYLDVNQIIKSEGISEGYDNERDCQVIDEEKLVKNLKKIIVDSKKGLVIDSHMAHYIPPKDVTCCVITKCELKELKKRLEKRGYSKTKVRENLDSEIFEICLQEAFEQGHKIIEFRTDEDNDIEDITMKINNIG